MKVLVTVFVLFSAVGFAHADVPVGCKECLATCPPSLACNHSCQQQCSAAQITEYRKIEAQDAKGESCYKCMNACPHNTKIMLECDKGCPSSCNAKTLRSAFLKLKQETKGCMKAASDEGPESDEAKSEREDDL